jgi:hypothetical protein
MKAVKSIIASTLIGSTLLMSFPMTAHAGIIPTSESTSVKALEQRQAVNTFFSREDVQRSLLEQGVSSQMTMDRVAAMSDDEVAQLAGKIDKAPAGGEILGVLFTVFVVLLVTDILGLTKVFPFTRSVR